MPQRRLYFLYPYGIWETCDKRGTSSPCSWVYLNGLLNDHLCCSRVVSSSCLSYCVNVSKRSMILTCCEMFCRMTSAWRFLFLSYPVALYGCLLFEPGLLEVALLLLAWRQSHVSRWVCFYELVFEVKTPGPGARELLIVLQSCQHN